MMLDDIQREWLGYIEDVIEQIMDEFATMVEYHTLSPERADLLFRGGLWE